MQHRAEPGWAALALRASSGLQKGREARGCGATRRLTRAPPRRWVRVRSCDIASAGRCRRRRRLPRPRSRSTPMSVKLSRVKRVMCSSLYPPGISNPYTGSIRSTDPVRCGNAVPLEGERRCRLHCSVRMPSATAATPRLESWPLRLLQPFHRSRRPTLRRPCIGTWWWSEWRSR
jgi:hypothetical protein